MRREQKIGFALGLLLVGIVAALFFRDETPQPVADELRSIDEINDRIAERKSTPYQIPETPTGTAPVVIEPPTIDNAPVAEWQVPEFLRERLAPPPTREVLPPDPIPLQEISQSGQRGDAFVRPSSVRSEPLEPAREKAATAVPVAASNSGWYTVVKGDTLSEIAEKQLGSAARFQEIFELNRDKLRDADDLRIGQKIRIPQRSTTVETASPIAPPTEPAATERTRVEEIDLDVESSAPPQQFRRPNRGRTGDSTKITPAASDTGSSTAPIAQESKGPLPLFIPYRASGPRR